MPEPKISVILPVYNVEPFIRQCLESIAVQTFSDIEVICVDDCGGDGSMAIAEEFCAADDRFRILRHTVNQRQGGARNTGMLHAKGKYIAFVDPDDWIDPDKYRKEYEAIERYGLDSVWSKYSYHYEDGVVRQDHEGWNSPGGSGGLTELQPGSLGIYSPSPCNKLYRADFLRVNRLVFPTHIYYEDTSFYFKFYTLSSKVYIIDEYLYAYRQHGASTMGITAVGRGKCAELMAMYEDCFAFLQERGLLEKWKEPFLQFITRTCGGFLYSRHYKSECMSLMREFLIRIGFPESYDAMKAYELLVISKSGNGRSRPWLYRPLSLLNKMNPISDLRRKWRKWIQVKYQAK